MKEVLKAQFYLIQGIRNFFQQNDFLDVLTPPAVTNPGMETHIHPFQIYSVKDQKKLPYYLHTSPEFHMKSLMSLGFKNIFTITYSFRDEPNSDLHRFQFLMLEWYRNCHYYKIMDDCEKLIKYTFKYLKQKKIEVRAEIKKFPRITVRELFKRYLKIDIYNYLEREKIRSLIKENYLDIPLPADDSSLAWDDYYFLLFLNKIEPHLKKYPYLLIYEFPMHLSALSTIKKDDPSVCERFEIYMYGIELCNCFNELTDLEIQKNRFIHQAEEKKKLYNYSLPDPEVLYQALERGLLPSSGIALGIERLLMALTNFNNTFWP